MSGGHFDHREYGMLFIAEDIQKAVDDNSSDEMDAWGHPVSMDYPLKVIEKFRMTKEMLETVHKMVHRIDYLLSGDDGPDSFLRRWNEEGLP